MRSERVPFDLALYGHPLRLGEGFDIGPVPAGSRSENSRAAYASLARMPSDDPYSDAFTMSTGSSRVPNFATGATGPKISVSKAVLPGPTSASTVAL